MAINKHELRILIVDGNSVDRATYRRLISRCPDHQYTFLEADSGEQGLELCRLHNPDCVLLDYDLPDRDGLRLLEELAFPVDNAPLPVVMITDQKNEAAAIEATRRGAQDYLVKGDLQSDALYRAVDNAIEKASLRRELQELRNQLEAKNHRLHELHLTAHRLVENVSSEFRAPLTAIKQFASMVRNGLPGLAAHGQREYIDNVNDRVDDLRNMVEDMLNISRLEVGSIGVFRRDCNVADLIEHHRTALQRQAVVSRAVLEIVIEEDLPTVYCDPNQIGQVIVSLTANALKFCGAGQRVEIWASHDFDDSQVVVGVSDTGPGIAPEMVRAIRAQLGHSGAGHRAGIKGFGLGLNVVKELMRLNFGELNVESEVGQGTTFTFTVPTADPQKLLERYLKCVRQFRDDIMFVSLLLGEVDPSIDPALLDDVGWFLQNRMRHSDLVIRTQPHTWLLVAPTNQRDLDPMMSRLARAWEQANRNRPTGALPAIVLEVLGTWRFGIEQKQLIERFEAEWQPLQEAHA